MTCSSPSWRSLNHSKGSLNHPEKVTKNCQDGPLLLRSSNVTRFPLRLQVFESSKRLHPDVVCCGTALAACAAGGAWLEAQALGGSETLDDHQNCGILYPICSMYGIFTYIWLVGGFKYCHGSRAGWRLVFPKSWKFLVGGFNHLLLSHLPGE